MSRSTADMLIRVSSLHRAAVAAGQSPVDVVAATLDITYSAAKRRIYRARLAGVLPPAREVFDKTS